jgi:hypothetical protein
MLWIMHIPYEWVANTRLFGDGKGFHQFFRRGVPAISHPKIRMKCRKVDRDIGA